MAIRMKCIYYFVRLLYLFDYDSLSLSVYISEIKGNEVVYKVRVLNEKMNKKLLNTFAVFNFRFICDLQ
jgi:hypothetical protein